MKETLKQADAMFKAAIRPHLEHGPITVGTTMLILGKTRTVACKDVPSAVERLLVESGGDIGTFCQCLAANPLKQGAFKQIVGEAEWEKHFEVKFSEKVEVRQLDTRYLDAS